MIECILGNRRSGRTKDLLRRFVNDNEGVFIVATIKNKDYIRDYILDIINDETFCKIKMKNVFSIREALNKQVFDNKYSIVYIDDLELILPIIFNSNVICNMSNEKITKLDIHEWC